MIRIQARLAELLLANKVDVTPLRNLQGEAWIEAARDLLAKRGIST